MVRSGELLIVVMPSGAHLAGQSRLGLRDAVLHQLLRLVRIGAEPERHRSASSMPSVVAWLLM